MNLADLSGAGRLETVDAAEVLGQEPGRPLADVADAERVEEPSEAARLGGRDGVNEIGRRLLGQPLELGELGHGQRVEVGEVADPPSVHELLDHGFAEMLDVHRPARAVVHERFLEARGTGRVRAPDHHLALRARGRRPADRAPIREDEWFRVGRPLLRDDADDVRDDVAGALDDHGVALAHVEPLDLVDVVEGRAADRRPCDLDRVELGRGRQGPRSAHVDPDPPDDGLRVPGRELVGDGPARVMGGDPEVPLLLETVDLYDHAVGLVGEVLSLGLQALAVGPHLVERGRGTGPRVRLEPRLAQAGQHLPVGLERKGIRVAELVDVDVEGPAPGNPGILLPDGAGRGVPWVGEGRLAGRLQLAVQALEHRPAHEDLAPDLDRSAVGERALEVEGDRADRPEVGCHVLADPAVSARRPADEAPRLVQESHPQPIHLGLAHVLEAGAGERPAEPGFELLELGTGRGVVEGEHRHRVLDGGERAGDLPRHPLGRGIGRDQLRVLGLERAKLPEEGVVLRVRDLRSIFDVVAMIVVGDQSAKLEDALGGAGGRGHESRIARAPRAVGAARGRGRRPGRSGVRLAERGAGGPLRHREGPGRQRRGVVAPTGPPWKASPRVATPRPTASQRVATRMSSVAAAARGSGVPKVTRSPVRLASATPRPPGSIDSAPAREAKA